MDKVRQEGLRNTIQQIREKLDDPMPLGYCSAGTVLTVGAGVQEFKPGDHVATAGPHAEVVCVPKNMCARIPDGVSFEEASFTVLGSIALQGVRLAELNLGETAFVIGLGLVGQIAVGLLNAAGVRVIGTDLDPAKCELAKRMGAVEARPGIRASDVDQMTHGLGADAVLITASTKSNGPIDLAAGAVRQKGRVVLVGVVGLELDRRPFYFKEAEFVVSCSYGPGRYDSQYEEGGLDYPAAYVRWTEQRNMQALLGLMSTGKLDVKPLISHRFEIENAKSAYDLIESNSEPYLGIILQYCEDTAVERSVQFRPTVKKSTVTISIGCLGAGNFARMTLLPKLMGIPAVEPHVLCTSGGLSASHCGKKLGFALASSDEQDVFDSDQVDAVFVLTRHDQHARQVSQGLLNGKHVFVEKPLCLNVEELIGIEESWKSAGDSAGILMVGFNRRFSPAAKAVKKYYQDVECPLTVSIRFNAGAIPADHWVQDEEAGGGRIIGEACHAIDLATYLIGSPVSRVFAESIGGPDAPGITDDQCFITLRHENGSVSNIGYLAGGDKSFSKERVEVFGGGKVCVIDDFNSAESWFQGKRKRLWKGNQDKGHLAELVAFTDAIKTGFGLPISWEEIRATTLASILAVQSLREGTPFSVVTESVSETARIVKQAG
ncbi:bi-domain-containing oxidoreductase [Rubinisphaera italica]|uniref:bi-domain-containing oxidoreductase n=1 Tax=Rubinisphaera italica TaxID=2527969 RepID=UPI001A943D37|nr:bi-domain-containing oxidoreductase [Rubinisphaera italica]